MACLPYLWLWSQPIWQTQTTDIVIREKIPAVVFNRLSDAAAAIKAERDENICRKDFTLSEAVAIGRTLEELERPNAKERQRLSEGRGNKRCDLLPHLLTGRTREIVGAAVGMSGATYERAKKVIEAAEAQNRSRAVDRSFISTADDHRTSIVQHL